MPKAKTEAIKAFNEALERCIEEIDKRQIRINPACVDQYVQDNKEAAYEANELKCILARHEPNYLKVATYVAWSYKFAFNDDTLITLVKNAANTAVAQGAPGADQAAAFVDQTLENLIDTAVRSANTTQSEHPARRAARKWWQETGKTEAVCDNCSKPIQRDEGYLISGRQWEFPLIDGSKRVIDIGEELICETCARDILSL